MRQLKGIQLIRIWFNRGKSRDRHIAIPGKNGDRFRTHKAIYYSTECRVKVRGRRVTAETSKPSHPIKTKSSKFRGFVLTRLAKKTT